MTILSMFAWEEGAAQRRQARATARVLRGMGDDALQYMARQVKQGLRELEAMVGNEMADGAGQGAQGGSGQLFRPGAIVA